MGDMADGALDEMMDFDEAQQRLLGIPEDEWDDVDREFMQDYDGTRWPVVF